MWRACRLGLVCPLPGTSTLYTHALTHCPIDSVSGCHEAVVKGKKIATPAPTCTRADEGQRGRVGTLLAAWLSSLAAWSRVWDAALIQVLDLKGLACRGVTRSAQVPELAPGTCSGRMLGQGPRPCRALLRCTRLAWLHVHTAAPTALLEACVSQRLPQPPPGGATAQPAKLRWDPCLGLPALLPLARPPPAAPHSQEAVTLLILLLYSPAFKYRPVSLPFIFTPSPMSPFLHLPPGPVLWT